MLSLILAAVLLTAVNAIEWGPLVTRALELAGISKTAACIDMELDMSQFNRGLSGAEHLSMKRLARLPVPFHQWLAVVIADSLGLPQECLTARRLEEATGFQQERRRA